MTTTSPSRSKWVPTQQSFENLLAALDSDLNEAGKQYERTRLKLLRYFERQQIAEADRYVDVSLDRVMRKLDEGEVITNIMGYIFKVAHFVRQEALREQDKMRKVSGEAELPDVTTPEIDIDPNPRQVCFDQCLEQLPIETRGLIKGYYSQDEGRAKIQNRKQMAQRLGITMIALRLRAHKIRVNLETCITDCVSNSA